ncbi:MAG: cytochrome P450, partial [Deinococcus sp.]|nr:cytochrome P450 [Deinococcus sp.]
HGPCFRVRALNREFVVLGGPAAAEAMAKNAGEFDAWSMWENVIREFGGRQVLSMLEGEPHRRYRAAARAGFAKTRVQDNIPLILSLAREALDAVPHGQSFVVGEFAQRLVADCVGMLTLGRRPGDSLRDFITYWHTQLSVNLAGTRSASALTKRDYLEAKARARAAAEELLALDENTLPSPYVRDLRAFMHENPDLMNEEELLFMMLLPYVAGLDTVVNVLTLSLYYAYRDPELYARLRAEIDPLLAEGLPAARLRDLKVLHALVLEVMRYHPIANMLTRQARQNFEFQGYHIREGEQLMMALMASQRDPALFRDPERFDVDRFLAPRNEHRQKNALNPYGAGAHTCLGAGMAETLLAALISATVGTDGLHLFPAGYQMRPFHSSQLSPDPNLRLIRL